MWPATGLYAEIWFVPNLLQRAGLERADPRGGKGKLVKEENSMTLTDPIADMLTRIRNACKAKHKKVDIPSSSIKKDIARILMNNKFISNFVEVEDSRQNLLRVFLKYDQNNRSYITGLVRISKPGLRIYVQKEDLNKFGRVLGIVIVSTSKGIMTHQEAKSAGVGGEAICRVW
jgi:small subunit ribosomal protein S8